MVRRRRQRDRHGPGGGRGTLSARRAGALTAFHLRIPVMHLEAGLRTGGGNLTPCAEELARAGRAAGSTRVAGLPAHAGLAGIVGITLVAAIVPAVTVEFRFWGEGPGWQLRFFYLLGFGGTVLGCIAARSAQGARGWLAGLALG
jgi:hypothetical protein